MFKRCSLSRGYLYLMCLCLIVLVFIYVELTSKDLISKRYTFGTDGVVGDQRHITATCRSDSTGGNASIHEPVRLYPKEGVGTRVEINNDFDFTVFNSFCDRNTDIIAIIPVYSATDNFKRRQAIRDTVGRNCVKLKCAVFFIVGVSTNVSVNEGVRKEYMSQKDILIVSMIDTYRDLNNKAMAMLGWLARFCPYPKYVLHIIDDTYPNIRYFIEHMSRINGTKYILGSPFTGAHVVREPANKWFISLAEYPVDIYPTYTLGTAYGFLNSNCRSLRDAAFKALYVWVEDVWLTGCVRIQAGFDIVKVDKVILNVPSTKDPNIWSKYFCVHQVSVGGFYDIYNATLDKM